jgi:uncharacterized OsmC-like protein
MAVKVKVLSFDVALDRAGGVSAEQGAPIELPVEWQAEHLLLAGLARCSLTSLRYHARRLGIDDLVAGASASGRVTKREEDGRYAFVEVECRMDVELEPGLPLRELEDLLSKAERDCFVGASLTAPPLYRWTVNGEAVSGA